MAKILRLLRGILISAFLLSSLAVVGEHVEWRPC
jgi:hypothetical protein